MSEYIRLQANGADAYPDASTENTYRPNGTSVESALVNLESNVTTLGGVAGEAKTLAEQNSVKIATAEQEISDINSSLEGIVFGIPDYSRATTIINKTSTSKEYTLPEDGFIYYMVSGNSTLMITATINNKDGYRFGGRAETNYAVGGMVYMPKGTQIKAISSSSEYVLEFIPLK